MILNIEFTAVSGRRREAIKARMGKITELLGNYAQVKFQKPGSRWIIDTIVGFKVRDSNGENHVT
jgi:hypothetical protein